MKLTPTQKLIMQGKICPYCKQPSEYIDSKELYGVSYGMMYICRPCDSWVGTHKSRPLEALGRLANKELREAKKEAHSYFDLLWKNKRYNRDKCYSMLSSYLQIPKDYTHIGMFGVETCKQVAQWAKEKYVNSLYEKKEKRYTRSKKTKNH